LRFISYTTKHI